MERLNDKIVIKAAEDAIWKADGESFTVNHYTSPFGADRINEVSDATYRQAKHKTPYHFHDCGVETFMILKGRVEVTLYGKHCVCEEGDIINIPSHCPHGMVFLDEGTVCREMFSGMDKLSDRIDRDLLTRNTPQYAHDSEFMEKEFDPAHHFFLLTEPEEAESVEKDSLPQITPRGKFLYEYNGITGIHCQLKVGRWNLKNAKEIWEFQIGNDYQLQYSKPMPNEGIYMVKSGKVMVEVNGDSFFAEENDLIHIPPYTPYTMTASGGDTVILDLNSSARLFRMLEMLELAQKNEPEKTKDPEWMKWLLEMNGCGLTGFHKINKEV